MDRSNSRGNADGEFMIDANEEKQCSEIAFSDRSLRVHV